MKKIYFLILLLCFSGQTTLRAQALKTSEIDKLVEKSIAAFRVPGIALGIVKDGQLVYARGYGVRSLKSGKPVDANTLFGIASNSKAFTTAALAILVDAGKLNWDDRVIDYIPEFRTYSAYVTEDFTIRDLLTHRSGMGLGAGDLMLFPDSSDFTLQELIHTIRYFKQTSPFRSKFDYDNRLYIVAGEIVHRVAGRSWEDFVEKKIMRPLGMKQSAASFDRLKDKSNVIDAHAAVDEKIRVISRHKMQPGENAAGGIYANINDLSKWVLAQLNGGKYGSKLGKYLFSAKAQHEMWAAQTILPVGKNSYRTHFRAYGLGWFLSDVNGYKQVRHTGGLEGMVTEITLLPELHLGIIVLTNQESGAAFKAISNTIKDGYMGREKIDWVSKLKKQVEKRKKKADTFTKKIWSTIDSLIQAKRDPLDMDIYAGNFNDNWLGDVQVSQKKGRLWFQSLRSPKLGGEMFFYKGNTFVVKWRERSMHADAFVSFNLDREGKAMGFTMKAVSPLTDFSYDFRDLNFKRVEN